VKRRETLSLPTSHIQYPFRSTGTSPCGSDGRHMKQQHEGDSSERAKVDMDYETQCSVLLSFKAVVFVGARKAGAVEREFEPPSLLA
jgi:hypothetical protein